MSHYYQGSEHDDIDYGYDYGGCADQSDHAESIYCNSEPDYSNSTNHGDETEWTANEEPEYYELEESEYRAAETIYDREGLGYEGHQPEQPKLDGCELRELEPNGYQPRGLDCESDDLYTCEDAEYEPEDLEYRGKFEPSWLGDELECDANGVFDHGEADCEDGNAYTHPNHYPITPPSPTVFDGYPSPTSNLLAIHRDSVSRMSNTIAYTHPTTFIGNNKRGFVYTHLSHTPTPSDPPPTPSFPPSDPSPTRAIASRGQRCHVTTFDNNQHELTHAGDTGESHTVYPARTNLPTPLSCTVAGWRDSTPRYLVQSNPLSSQRKRRRYKRSCVTHYPYDNTSLHCASETSSTPPIHNIIPTPMSLTPFLSCSDAEGTLTTAQVPATPFATDKLGCESPNHQALYSTARSRPPPWPIKQTPHSQRLRVTNSRPPAWPPNQHYHHHRLNSPIQTPGIRPPPWPIKLSRTAQSVQNNRNAKRRLSAKPLVLPGV